jgi:transcription-repair coupling factor (superfamily II helicase)
LKGEPLHEPAEIKLDLPLDAHLPKDYVPREDLRLEAYRRLAAVTREAEVDDIRNEWQDRYGPVPPPAVALLDVARLRAECARTGIREVNVGKGPGFGKPAYVVRLSPVELKVSQEVRLSRLVKDSVYKADARQVQLPVRKPSELVDGLVLILRELFPPDPASEHPTANLDPS